MSALMRLFNAVFVYYNHRQHDVIHGNTIIMLIHIMHIIGRVIRIGNYLNKYRLIMPVARCAKISDISFDLTLTSGNVNSSEYSRQSSARVLN